MTQSKNQKRLRGVRLDASVVEDVEQWRREQREIPSRAEAIHTLVGLGLAAERESRSDGERTSP
jgi:hypothetical protein